MSDLPPLRTPWSASEEPSVFLFVKIPVSRDNPDPQHLREDRIDQALRAQGIGWVVGWGDSLGTTRPNGLRIPAFIRVDITATALDAALEVLRALLPTLDTPVGVQIHYTQAGRHCMDLATEAGWQMALSPG